MSTIDKARDAFAAIKAAAMTAAPGLGNLSSDLTAEASRQGGRGAMEIAAALFGGNAYVQYGPGQSVTESTRDADQVMAEPAVTQEPQERGQEQEGREP